MERAIADFSDGEESQECLVVAVDPAGRIVSFNAACERLTGYSRDEVLGKSLLDLFVPEDWREVVLARFARIDSGELRFPHVNPWKAKNGELKMIEWRCSQSPNAEEKPLIVGIGFEVMAVKNQFPREWQQNSFALPGSEGSYFEARAKPRS